MALLLGLFCASCCLPLPFEPPPPPAPVPVVAAPAPIAPRAARLSRWSFETMATGAVPQVSDPGALFDAAPPHASGPIERGLLLCRTDVRGGGYDDSFFAGGADIALSMRLDDGDVRLTPQSPRRVYSMPVARLDPGDPVWMRVVDIDVIVHDTVAEGATSFQRTPFRLGMGQANVECRAIDGATVEAPARAALASMSRAVDELERAEPSVAREDVGYPHDRAQEVLEAASGVLAWLERSDREYAALVARTESFDVEWTRRAVAEVNRASSTLPAPGAVARVSAGKRLRVARVACGEEANVLAGEIGEAMSGTPAGCLVVLELELLAATSIPPMDREAYLECSAIDRNATTTQLFAAARRHRGAWVAPAETIVVGEGERVEIVLALGVSADAQLLRVRDGGEPVVLRLR